MKTRIKGDEMPISRKARDARKEFVEALSAKGRIAGRGPGKQWLAAWVAEQLRGLPEGEELQDPGKWREQHQNDSDLLARFDFWVEAREVVMRAGAKCEKLGLRLDLNHALALVYLKQHLPGFSFTVESRPNSGYLVRYKGYPRVDGQHPSLADLVRFCSDNKPDEPVPDWRKSFRVDSFEPNIMRHVQPIVDAEPVKGEEFVRFLIKERVYLPPVGVIGQAVAQWFTRYQSGVPSRIVAFVCPDWGHSGGYYTFANLGRGIGLVAQRFLDKISAFAAQFPKADFDVVIGDFEGHSAATCERLGIDETEFTARCVASNEAFFAEACRRDRSLAERLTMHLATDYAGGRAQWEAALGRARDVLVAEGLAKAFKLDEKSVGEMLAGRRSLYERWHGEGVDVAACLAAQAPEYGAMASLTGRHSDNVFIVGCDDVHMAPCMQIHTPAGFSAVPVLYLRHSAY